MSLQLSKETIVEWLEKCDYLKCSSQNKQALISFGSERLYLALHKLPLAGRIDDVAPRGQNELGFSLLQHYFEIDEADGATAEDAKAYKQNIRCKSIQHVNAYLSLMMRTVARELAGPEYAYDGIHNADGGMSADGDNPSVIINQEIVDRCGNGGNASDQSEVMPSLSGGVGSETDWDPDADIYGVEPSSGANLPNDIDLASKVAGNEELGKRADLEAVEKIEAIRKIKNCGACYYVLTLFNGDYGGILGKTSFYDGASKIREIIFGGDRALDMRRLVALRIQSFFENDWWKDPNNAEIVARIENKRAELRKKADSVAYDM